MWKQDYGFTFHRQERHFFFFFHKTQLWIWLKHTAAVVQLWVSAKAFCSCWSNSSDSSGLENWFQSRLAGFTLFWFAWLLEPTQMLCKSFVLRFPLKETIRNQKWETCIVLLFSFMMSPSIWQNRSLYMYRETIFPQAFPPSSHLGNNPMLCLNYDTLLCNSVQ